MRGKYLIAGGALLAFMVAVTPASAQSNRTSLMAENQKIMAEFEKLSAKMEADRAKLEAARELIKADQEQILVLREKAATLQRISREQQEIEFQKWHAQQQAKQHPSSNVHASTIGQPTKLTPNKG